MMRLLKTLTGKNGNSTQLMEWVPNVRRDDDIFLVSYPKSGVTWIAFIIANLIVQKLELDLEVNYFNIHGFIPDIHAGKNIPEEMGFFPFKRIIKSHSEFTGEYKNVLYLVRDPRSVMVSYYKYLKGLGQFDGNISSFIANENCGIIAWRKHVNGWFDTISPSTRFRYFRYEDFKENSLDSTRLLAQLLGVTAKKTELEEVLSNCTFEKMKKLEKETSSLSLRRYDKKFRFVREGKVDGWRSELSEEDLSYIYQEAGELIDQFGYSLK